MSERHDEPGDDLYGADDVHRILGAAGDQVVELGRQVLGPVADHDLGELVESEQNRRDGEGDAQDQERLRGGIRAQHAGSGERNRAQGRRNGAHVDSPLSAVWPAATAVTPLGDGSRSTLTSPTWMPGAGKTRGGAGAQPGEKQPNPTQ